MRRLLSVYAPALAVLALPMTVGCAGDDEPESTEGNFTSREAVLVELEFDGELVTSQSWSIEGQIEDQMLYTIGHLNGDNSVGRLDAIQITDVVSTRLDDNTNQVKYHAKLPAGWGKKNSIPETYKLTLPKRVDSSGLSAFTEKYKHDCVDWGAHDVDTGSMWYYFRPNKCQLADEDVVRLTATVTKSELNTTGKYPEYHKVWEDDTLSVVAIFGKYEDGATSGDSGIDAYNNFVRAMRDEFEGETLTPAEVPSSPGVDSPDITLEATLADGKKVRVNMLLVDNVRTAGYEFDQRYASLSADADLIFYNGHAGLGANIRALARKGKFQKDKYQIFFMNGCDTFAYVDSALAEEKSSLNEDDPNGTKYLDVVTNVMPSFFSSMPYASKALVDGMLSYGSPMTYEEIFANIDRSEVVVVTGEEDNVFEPGGPAEVWEMVEAGSVANGESLTWETETHPAGRYAISITEDTSAPGGDADLYVAIGRAPTLEDWDQRPWLDGSNEQVELELAEPTTIHIMVHGYEYASGGTSAFTLLGRELTE
jgi:hypothetical protein